VDVMGLFDITPLSWPGLLAVFTSGLIIGLERQFSGKAVGIRTSVLICLGTYVFVRLGEVVHYGPGQDPTRVLSMVITGVGFLGAGVMFSREGSIIGVTSAATIWVLAAIGATIGVGYLLAGVKISLVSVFILVGITQAEVQIKALQRGVHQKFFLNKKRNEDQPDYPGSGSGDQ